MPKTSLYHRCQSYFVKGWHSFIRAWGDFYHTHRSLFVAPLAPLSKLAKSEPFNSKLSPAFVQGAEAFRLANPCSPFFKYALSDVDLAERAHLCLNARVWDLEAAVTRLDLDMAQLLDHQRQAFGSSNLHHQAPASAALSMATVIAPTQKSSYSSLLMSLVKQRQQLVVEREALCLLAYYCKSFFEAAFYLQQHQMLLSSTSQALRAGNADLVKEDDTSSVQPPPKPPFHTLGYESEPELTMATQTRSIALEFPTLDEAQPLLLGQSVLSFFVNVRHLDLCELLLDLGANPEASTPDGISPLELAERKAIALEGHGGYSGYSDSAFAEAQLIAGLLQRQALDRVTAKRVGTDEKDRSSASLRL